MPRREPPLLRGADLRLENDNAMAAVEGIAGADAERAEVRKVVLASLVGTTIEFYDFYIFGTAAALVFGPMFFPKSAPETQTLNAYLTFGIVLRATARAA